MSLLQSSSLTQAAITKQWAAIPNLLQGQWERGGEGKKRGVVSWTRLGFKHTILWNPCMWIPDTMSKLRLWQARVMEWKAAKAGLWSSLSAVSSLPTTLQKWTNSAGVVSDHWALPSLPHNSLTVPHLLLAGASQTAGVYARKARSLPSAPGSAGGCHRWLGSGTCGRWHLQTLGWDSRGDKG